VVKKRIKQVEKFTHEQLLRLRKVHFGNPDKNLYDTGKLFIDQLQKDDITERAGSMAFSFFVALFPLLLFLLNLIPYLQHFFPLVTTENILGFITEIVPGDIFEEMEGTITDIVSRPRQSLLSFGFFFALFASSQGVISMMNSFNSVYQTNENRGFFKSRGISVLIVFILVLTIIVASTTMIFGSIAIQRIETLHVFNSEFMIFLFNSLKFLVLLLVFYFSSAFIFRFAPAVHDKWHFFSIGANIAGLLITLSFYGFTFYLNNFASYNKLYGSIGTLIALMLWLYITSLIILISFEVNVTMDLLDEKKKRMEEESYTEIDYGD
jgi:membrane protein